MKLYMLYEDKIREVADIIIKAIDEFLISVRQIGFSKWKAGDLNVDNIKLHYSINFAGGDLTQEYLNDDESMRGLKEFLDEEFPMDYDIGGMQPHKDQITVIVRFNPCKISKYINLTGEDFRSRVESTIDHELAHITKSYPRIQNSTQSQYGRMPDELHANVAALVNAAKRSNKPKTLDQLLQILSPHVQKCYQTPKWRKILIKHLIKNGVDLIY